MKNSIITLDVWNTLITPNPNMHNNLSKYIAKVTGCGERLIMDAYIICHQSADKRAEKGKCYSQKVIYKDFCEIMGVDSKLWKTVRTAVEQCFIDNPPYIHPELASTLFDLVWNSYSLAIVSNNNFISGKIINTTVLDYLDVKFEFQLNSTDIKSAKLGKDFMAAYAVYVSDFDKVIHLGDNPICDNFNDDYVDKTYIIKNPADCIRVLKEIYKS